LIEIDSTDPNRTSNDDNDDDTEVRNETGHKFKEGIPGFDLPGQSVNAVFLDLPEPWLAVPHAAYILKPNGRIASYSPCVEQTQRTVSALEQAGFHSIKTMEYRLQEHYVDEYESIPPPYEKLRRPQSHNISVYDPNNGENNDDDDDDDEPSTPAISNKIQKESATTSNHDRTVLLDVADSNNNINNNDDDNDNITKDSRKRKRNRTIVVARPFVTMRGHTAFLTFATAGLVAQPNPNE
jgi:tRNA (adenine57-N1/adenine58-N1)-methyltransferase